METGSIISIATGTMMKIIDVSIRIGSNESKRNFAEKDHLRELSKVHIQYTITIVRDIKAIMETLMRPENNYEINNDINDCLNNIYVKLLLIEGYFISCSTLGNIQSMDTVILYEQALDLLTNYCLRLQDLSTFIIAYPFVSINKIKDYLNKVRPIVHNQKTISLKSDRNEKFLGMF
jgi:predicted DNA-binding ArsR family transcriptional regulator